MQTENLRYKIGIGLIPKIGPILTKRLIAYCGSIEAVFKEKQSALSRIPGIGSRLAEYIFANRQLDKADKEIEWLNRNHVEALFYLDDNYPERLKQCEDAPIILYIKGTTRLSRPKVISIVGTRNPTEEGRIVTRELVRSLAANYPDILVVSGLAYGIDICAHRSALRNDLDTVAVLGHGLSHMYPYAHREIAIQITGKGALLTEFRHDEKPETVNFVKRNRIIAGMADATVVVESGERGGALITADIANSYNRDVFAFPGRVVDKSSTGCNRLIKSNRAALIETVSDLEYLMGWQKAQQKDTGVQKQLFIKLEPEENQLVELLRATGSLTLDQLSLQANMQVSRTSSALLNLEFKGLIKCLPGKVFKLIE